MIPSFDIIDREETWTADLVSDLVLSGRLFSAHKIGNPVSFWRG